MHQNEKVKCLEHASLKSDHRESLHIVNIPNVAERAIK